jgi:hypothetical protein
MKNHKHKRKQKKVKRQRLRIVHPHAAGIDVGSRKHYVAIPAECGDETVRHFGCLTPDLHLHDLPERCELFFDCSIPYCRFAKHC